jgi:uncharacterized membrane protein
LKLDVSVEVPYPREQVFSTYRDKLPELVPYLPNVRSITVTSRTEAGGVVHVVSHWKGGGDIPAMVRKFLSEELLEWDDVAAWHHDAFRTDWHTVLPALKEALRAQGTNRFEDLGGGRTRIVIAGELEVDARQLKAVPRLLASAVGPAVEAFLVGAIKPNLVGIAQGVQKYLDAQR